MSKDVKKLAPIPVAALLLAWLVPGAGHVYVGRVTRGIIIFLVVSITFWAGVAMGGVMTVDPQNERWWFVAEMGTGVDGLVGWQIAKRAVLKYEHQADEEIDKVSGTPDPLRRVYVIDALMARDGVALVTPTDTVARAYAGVAGLLNLLCAFDALMLAVMGVTGEPRPPAPPDDKDKPAIA